MEPAFRTYGGFDAAGLRVIGELDLGSRDRLRSVLRELAARDVDRVWLDLEGVIFIDCGCLRELEWSRRVFLASGRRFELTAASAMFVRVAELACTTSSRRWVAPSPGSRGGPARSAGTTTASSATWPATPGPSTGCPTRRSESGPQQRPHRPRAAALATVAALR
jgi:anti-anti-sigma factor